MKFRWILLPLLSLVFLTSCGNMWSPSPKTEYHKDPLPPVAFATTDDLVSYLKYDEGDSWDTRDREVQRIAEEDALREELMLRLQEELTAVADVGDEDDEEAIQ